MSELAQRQRAAGDAYQGFAKRLIDQMEARVAELEEWKRQREVDDEQRRFDALEAMEREDIR